MLVSYQAVVRGLRSDITSHQSAIRPPGRRKDECDHPESFQTAEGLGLQCVVRGLTSMQLSWLNRKV